MGELTDGRIARMSVSFQIRSIMTATSGVAVCLESRPIMATSSGGRSLPSSAKSSANAGPYSSVPHNSAVSLMFRSMKSRSIPQGKSGAHIVRGAGPFHTSE